MMNQNKKHLSKGRSLFLALAIILSSFFIHACQTDDSTASSNIDKPIEKAETSDGIYKFSVTDTVISFNPETFEEKMQRVKTDYEAYKNPETTPLYPGCTDKECTTEKLIEYLYENLVYPDEARKNNVQGMVVLQFVITDTGDIVDLKIARDIAGGCGQAAFKALQSLQNLEQKWIPGANLGQKVNVQYTLPVKFKID